MLNYYSPENSGGGPRFPNGEISGNGNSIGAAVSRDVIFNENRIAADATANYFEPCKAPYGTRALLQQREEELQQELAILKAQCHEKDMEIVYLKNKMSELKNLGQEKESEFEQKMEETVQELTKLKRAAFLANGNFVKRNSEFEKLKKELQTTKEHELKLSSLIKEEVKSLRQGLGEIRDEVFHGNDKFSRQAVRLKNLLTARKACLTSFQGCAPLLNASKPRVSKAEDHLLVNALNQPLKDEKGAVKLKYQSGSQNKVHSECALFRAENYFALQPSEFDFLTDIVIANGPFRADSLRPVRKEITKAKSPTHNVKEPNGLGHKPRTVPVSEGDYPSKKEVSKKYMKAVNAPGYLNNRPLPANSPIDTYCKPKTPRATRCLNNRPLPLNSSVSSTYPSSWTPVNEAQGGMFGRTLSQWFGF